MSIQEKLGILEEIMELEEGELKVTDVLADFEEWDSIAILSYIAMMDSQFTKTVKGQEIKAFVTVQDALDMMEA